MDGHGVPYRDVLGGPTKVPYKIHVLRPFLDQRPELLRAPVSQRGSRAQRLQGPEALGPGKHGLL